ncbi:Hypothetical predicted protein, partial [Olea europaea subsp. europaea]
LKQGHAPDHQITHEKANLRLKNHPIPTSDAPLPAIASSSQSLGKSQISANPELISENGTYCDDQHEIPHLPVKNHNFLTPLENHRWSTTGQRPARGGHAPVTLHQNVGNFVTDPIPSSVSPHEAQT